MPRFSRFAALAVVALAAAPAAAQLPGDDPFAPPAPVAAPKKRANKFFDFADVSFELDKLKVKRGETVTARLTITPKDKAWTYPFRPADPTQASKNDQATLAATPDYVILSRSPDPAGSKEKPRDNAPGKTDQYYPGPGAATWVFRVVVPTTAAPGKKAVAFGKDTTLQVCNERNCFTIVRDELPTAEFEVLDELAENPDRADLAAAEARLASRGPAPLAPSRGSANPPAPTPATPTPAAEAVGPKPAKPIATYEADLTAVRESLVHDRTAGGTGPTGGKDEGLGAFLATAALWGLISLVTPCVFPMIPITVSIFLKQAHNSLGERLKLAGVYSLTIIAVLGTSAFALLKFMAILAAHPATNIALGVLFFVLALSLFGMYELTLPNSLARRLQSKQQKGGVVGTIFGALAFTVISFTCVAPFLGGFAGISAGAAGDGQLVALPTAREVLGGLAFATAFAAPFFVLALVPGLLKALPRSGGWLDSVKVVMGFLEVAAALKFLRTAELRLLPTTEYFTYDAVLAGWVVLSAACGLYLLNLFRLPHDEERPNIGVPRLLFAVTFLGLAVYLAPALLNPVEGKRPRPAGAVYAWVEAFLLPEHKAGHADTDLKDAIERARRLNRPVFVDFTGETCTNCRYNELNVFTRPEVAGLLERFESVQLYTDEVPAAAYRSDPGREHRGDEAYANRSFEVAAFGTNALPTYAVLIPRADGTVSVFREPGGERRAIIEGKINTVSDFAAFLKAALEAAK
ncbi:protein-disulfide reductase DsbD family protein [Urbifossiella limnaea]|uniref:Thiol:disulfide interchange protein DsbD n=1 Tax=Urbifossiella limnaea TaxID=2528023 RepID=A0A517XPL6_9BACT|nr:thioredoxin family protein [Urbifossiella limnaea]QDU19451.1 Thiol:disulfide interchange protein DsbD precursor [Urbifossiella limnaea]